MLMAETNTKSSGVPAGADRRQRLNAATGFSCARIVLTEPNFSSVGISFSANRIMGVAVNIIIACTVKASVTDLSARKPPIRYPNAGSDADRVVMATMERLLAASPTLICTR